jgi:hypothetical protein
LPNDHEAIRRAIGATAAEWRRSWPRIERFWKVDGADLVNETQAEVYREAQAVRDRATERGRKGAQARAQAIAQAVLERDLKGEPPSPSPTNKIKSTGADAPGCAKPVEISKGKFSLYTVIAAEARDLSIRQDGDDSLGNISAIFKSLCGTRKLAYDGELAGRAIDAVLTAARKAS